MKVGGWSIAVVVILAVIVFPAAAQSPTPSECSTQKNNLRDSCRNVVFKPWEKTSAACCQLVRATNTECICPYVSSKLVAALGGAQRAIRLVQSCGRAIPRNFKCGRVTTPP